MIGKGVVHGAEELRKKLQRIRKEVPDLLSKERLGTFLLRRMRERYLQEKDPDGHKWKSLSAKSKQGPQILVQTGNLFKSMDIINGAPGGNYALATGSGFRIGIKSRRYTETFKRGGSRTVDTDVYGRTHQQGDGQVRRQFIGVGASDQRAVMDLYRRELRRIIK